MVTSIHHRIKMLIEETNDAFTMCDGTINTDYAEFAALAVSDFKQALHNPRLTRKQLTKMIRSGAFKHRNIDPESNWSSFMAHYIARKSNKNDISNKSDIDVLTPRAETETARDDEVLFS